jgi:hypothetical protein
MQQPANLLMIQFLDWVAGRPRTRAEAMEAWRTSCPRLSIWEDAQIDGLIEFVDGASRGRCHPLSARPGSPRSEPARSSALTSAGMTSGAVT